MSDFITQCFTPKKLNGLSLKNRFIKAGTFEGMSPQGTVSPALSEFHNRIADGGVSMTTIGYCAIENDGRLHEHMLYMHEGIRNGLTKMIESLHAKDCKVSGQMGYCGGFSKNRQLERKRPLGPSFGLNLLGITQGIIFCDAMNQRDIDLLVKCYGDAAAFMKSVGFDCLEIHFGHGYGLCQFMSPKTNKRTDQYGGLLQNRMRLPLQVLESVRKAVGDDFPVIGKISLTEGVQGGLNFDDAIEIAKLLDRGGIDGIVTSGGTSTMNPMIMFRGDNILLPMLKAEKSRLMRMMLTLAGPKLFKNYPYNELYFFDPAKKLRDAVSCSVIYVGGASNSTSFATLMESGFDFIQLGRSLLCDPDLPLQIRNNARFASRCLHCNECVATIEHPMGIHCTRFGTHS